MRQKELLIIYDVPNWAYHARAKALQCHAPEWCQVTICELSAIEKYEDSKFDLIFLLDYAAMFQVAEWRQRNHALAKFVISFNAGPHRRNGWWAEACGLADFVICNNVPRFNHRMGHDNCCAISNGYDEATYRSTIPIEGRPDRCLWIGTEGKRRLKGYDSVLAPLRNLAEAEGFVCDFELVGPKDKRMTAADMVSLYGRTSYVLCASKHEETANMVLEGAACGCVAVSTPTGTIAEWGIDGENCVIPSAQTADGFLAALRRARAGKALLSRAGQEAVRSWRYDTRARYFFTLFAKLLDNTYPAPFIWSDVQPEEI